MPRLINQTLGHKGGLCNASQRNLCFVFWSNYVLIIPSQVSHRFEYIVFLKWKNVCTTAEHEFKKYIKHSTFVYNMNSAKEKTKCIQLCVEAVSVSKVF